MPWLWNSFHRTIRIDALVVLPRRISDLMPTQRTQLAPQSIRLDDSPGISRFLLDPQCRRSVYIRCVDTGIARLGTAFSIQTFFSYKRLRPGFRGLQENTVLAVEVYPRS